MLLILYTEIGLRVCLKWTLVAFSAHRRRQTYAYQIQVKITYIVQK